MKTNAYILTICCFFWSLLAITAQDRTIMLQESFFRVPSNELQLTRQIEAAKNKKAYTHCGDIYRKLRYEKDSRKRKQFEKQAVKFYKKAINNGEVEAYHRMAYMYYYGRGVKGDDKKCLEYLQEAARKGYVPAELNLGMLYLLGKSRLVPKNADKAESYLISTGGSYSSSITTSSPKFLENEYRKTSLELLIRLYTEPHFSHNGRKMNLDKAIRWSTTLGNQAQLQKLYDRLSDYNTLVSWTKQYPDFLPGLSLELSYQRLTGLDSAWQSIQKKLPMLGKDRFQNIEHSMVETYISTQSDSMTHEQALVFLQEMQLFLKKRDAYEFSAYDIFFEKLKTIETHFAQHSTPSTRISSIQQAHDRMQVYPPLKWKHDEAMQKIIFSAFNIHALSEENLRGILPIIVQKTWKRTPTTENIFTEGERSLLQKENSLPMEKYIANISTRWQKYPLYFQKKSFSIALQKSINKWGAEVPIKAHPDLHVLTVVPKKGILNAQRLQDEVLEMRKIARLFKIQYKFGVVEEALLKAQSHLSFQVYQKAFTSKTDLTCTAEEAHYKVKKAYYEGLLERMRPTFDIPSVSRLAEKIFRTDRMHVSQDGKTHSYKNLWIFVHEFLLKIHPEDQNYIFKYMSPSVQSELCRAMNESGKIRFYALVKANAQYSIKWHAAHTSPNCIPTWSDATKQRCSFCTFQSVKDPHLSKKYYDSYSALAYAEEFMLNPSLTSLLKSLGAQKEPRDFAREAYEKREKEKEAAIAEAEKEKARQHSAFLKTLKTGNCVEGYIYYDCKPPFVSREYYRIKVRGRLTSVATGEDEYCFIKVTNIERIDFGNRSDDDWDEDTYLRYCGERELKLIGEEHGIVKREILNSCH